MFVVIVAKLERKFMMSLITRYYSQDMMLFVSQPKNPNLAEIQAKLDNIITKPKGLVDDDGQLQLIDPPVNALNDKFEENPGDLMAHITKPHLQSNVLIAIMGELLLTDLTEYIEVDGLKTITVDHFDVNGGEIHLIFKIVAEKSADMDLILHQLEGQISDGWGEDGTKELPLRLDEMPNSVFFDTTSTTIHEALFDIERYESMPPDIQTIMYNPDFVEELLQALTYQSFTITLRLAFGLGKLSPVVDF